MSPGLKFWVTARGPVLNMVMVASPETEYCHSSALGCQCISRKPPGYTFTKAAAMVCDALKLRLSAMRTSPPAVFLVGGMLLNAKVDGFGILPAAPAACSCSAANGPGICPGKI